MADTGTTDLFDNISDTQYVDYIAAQSADELLSQLRKIRLPVQVISIYANGGTHFAWIKTQAKLKKVTK